MQDERNSKTAGGSVKMHHEIENVVASDYATPQIFSLGRSENLVQGGAYYGMSDSSNQWCWTP